MADTPLLTGDRAGNATAAQAPSGSRAEAADVVALPSAAPAPVRQPSGRAAGAYRKANPWPGNGRPPVPGPREAFRLARYEAEIAECRYRLSGAIAGREWEFGQPGDGQRAREEHWHLFDAYLAAMAALAETPAIDAAQLRSKVATIGRTWLTAEGEARFDSYRAAIARDAERLGVKNPMGGDKGTKIAHR